MASTIIPNNNYPSKPFSIKDNYKYLIKNILLRHEGNSNPITAPQLSNLFHLDERIIRRYIRELISDGLPIASSTQTPQGYFVISNFHEAKTYSESIKGRLIEDAKRRRDFNVSASLYLGEATQGRLL